MLKISIPESISAADRRKALDAARRSARRHEIIMRHTGTGCDLGAFRHAREMYRKGMEAVRAWEAVQV